MKKIFLVDDDEDDRVFFKEALELINPTLQCETAADGKMALNKLKAFKLLPDIIFLDLNMPIMNGLEFLNHIKKENPFSKIPIGIFTTSNNGGDKAKAKALGANFFIVKPVTFPALHEKLQQVLAADFSTGEFISFT